MAYHFPLSLRKMPTDCAASFQRQLDPRLSKHLIKVDARHVGIVHVSAPPHHHHTNKKKEKERKKERKKRKKCANTGEEKKQNNNEINKKRKRKKKKVYLTGNTSSNGCFVLGRARGKPQMPLACKSSPLQMMELQ